MTTEVIQSPTKPARPAMPPEGLSFVDDNTLRWLQTIDERLASIQKNLNVLTFLAVAYAIIAVFGFVTELIAAFSP